MVWFRHGLFVLALTLNVSAAADRPAGPNIVLIVCDNLGYGDVGPFGSTLHRTPHLDQMAKEGRKLTHFYAASGVCTPSRAALMTGCYPMRINLHKNARGGVVLQPVEPIGLHPSEVTIAEVMKTAGRATMLIGKWHLGDQPPFLPTRQGFDTYSGIPYSDDMTPRPGQPWPPLPLMKDERVVEAPVDRDQLTQREAREAAEFIERNRARPFFLYVAHAMPGSTTTPYASARFKGKSRNGAWGDAVEELDWALGEIMGALRRNQLSENTLVIWTSDNGAPQRRPPQGSNLPLAGWGYSTQEGGMRVPGIAWWPGRIPAGTECAELMTLMDLLPTFAELTGAAVPQDRVIDGKSIVPLLEGRVGARTPHEAFYYYMQDQLQALRSGPWKLYLPLERRRAAAGKIAEGRTVARLYNVEADPGETTELASAQANVVESLLAHAERGRQELGDLGKPGRGQRPAGWVPDPIAQEKKK